MPDVQTLARKFCEGENAYDVDAATWRSAFQYIDTHIDELEFERDRVHLLWTESGGHLRNRVRDDALLLRVLRKALPRYAGPGLTVFRGECKFLHEQGQLGFCWSPQVETADLFARGLNAIESGGVLLKAYAPPESILAGPSDHSASWLREVEYTCDPQLLKNVVPLKAYPRP